MKISKILNNNTAMVIEDNKEVIVIGKGLAYKKKTGDLINPALIEKKFSLESVQINTRFQDIIVSLSTDEILIVDKIITNIRMNLSKKISDSIYPALCDHIHNALMNCEKGIVLKNELLFDISRFYSDEYKLGKDGLKIIQEETGILLSDDEAGFIALHIVNAETENNIGTDKVQKSTKLIEEILDIIKNYFNKEIKEDTITYYRFINHLRFFSQRIVSNAPFQDDANDETLLEMMKISYQDSYLCAMNIVGFISGRYGISVGKNELVYLIIHIQRTMFNC